MDELIIRRGRPTQNLMGERVALTMLAIATITVLTAAFVPLPPAEVKYVEIPADWEDAVARSDLLWTADDQNVKSTLKATVGNGYLAAQIDAPTMFVAGVFNGPADGNYPSHRAAISSPLNLSPAGSRTAAAGLDLRGARYIRRSSVDTHESAMVEQRWYAHRSTSWKGLLILELESIGGAVEMQLLGGLDAVDTSDIQFSLRRQTIQLDDTSSSEVLLINGTTRQAETKETALVTVSIVVTAVPPGEFTLNGTRLFIASFSTSLETERPWVVAVSKYAQAMSMDPSELYASHAAEWDSLWQSGVELEGRQDAAVAINASLYYMLSSIRPDVVYSLSPGGLASNGYNGHTFWDCETWMWPPMLVWHPAIASSLLQYREQRIPFARKKALSYDPPYAGAMFPWESAFSGVETCPAWADTGQLEQHISGDIAFAVKQFFAMSRDGVWLNRTGYPLASAIADFWVSKAAQGTGPDGVAHIKHVIPPDEYATGDDSVYTNTVAKISLDFATKAATLVGQQAKLQWAATSSRIPILFDETRQYHPEYQGYYYGHKIKQADVVLLSFPLMVNMSATVRNNDLDAYEPVTDMNGPAMTWGMHAVGHLENGKLHKAAQLFNLSFANVQHPFAIWSETPSGGATNFITGAGGFLQTVLFGYTGLRIYDDHLRLLPRLIEGTTAMRVKGVHFRGHVFEMWYNANTLKLQLTQLGATASCPLCFNSASGAESHCLTAVGEVASFEMSEGAIFRVRCKM
ncbi:hypothetical protein AB1Y20_003114 [Prymnesium parvum]|uniref:Protein-glucosylgalactosylhydroxylysine glucosidase n=1 Tax=Prymnesium parvum TaxID=97485 RepID=A0AB34JCC8_PRYPA